MNAKHARTTPMKEIVMADRPNPLKEVANRVGVAWSFVTGLVSAGVTYGLLTAAQADAINAAGEALPPTILALGTVIGGVLPLVSTLIGAFKTASVGRDHVTPISSPAIEDPAKPGTLLRLAPVASTGRRVGPIQGV